LATFLEEISSIKHEAFKLAQSLIKPSVREESGLYLVESANFVGQALASLSRIRSVFALSEEVSGFRGACAERNIPLYGLRAGLLQKLVGTGYETSVTAIAIVEKRLLTVEEILSQKEGFFLVGEGIQDPRNVGVLIRTAESAGCSGLLLSSNSAEPFSRAAVRSTTGSILRLPLCLCPDLVDIMRKAGERGISVVVSSGQAPETAYSAPMDFRPMMVVVGNETNGVTEEMRSVATQYVSLPMAPNGADSLNVTVAAGILLYEAVRQRYHTPISTSESGTL
jgi:TrmH family RNA methyltransferase